MHRVICTVKAAAIPVLAAGCHIAVQQHVETLSKPIASAERESVTGSTLVLTAEEQNGAVHGTATVTRTCATWTENTVERREVTRRILEKPKETSLPIL